MWCNRFSLEYFERSESDPTFGYLSMRRIQKSHFWRTFDETDMKLWAAGWYGGRCEICPRLPACLHNDRRFLILTNIVVIWSWKSSCGDIVVWYLMMLKRLSCFQLSSWIFSELLSPPHLLSTLPSGRMSCFVVKSSEKRPILQFEGTSYCGVRRFGLVLALSRVVSFFLGFKNQSLDWKHPRRPRERPLVIIPLAPLGFFCWASSSVGLNERFWFSQFPQPNGWSQLSGGTWLVLNVF